MTDITHERELAKALGDQEQMMKDLPNVLKKIHAAPPLQLKRFLEEAIALLRSTDPVTSILRSAHTQKGVARALGLSALSGLLHEWESELKANGHNQETEIRLALEHQLEAHQSIAETLLQKQPESEACHSPLQIVDVSLRSCVKRLEEEALPLAEFSLSDEVITWSPADLSLLRDFLIHGVNNSIDHGYIIPMRRGLAVEPPRIRIAATRVQGHIRLEIRDQGVGLAETAIASLAKAKGFVPAQGESWLDVLFWDGVSTAETLTQTSGRGVGLAALKAEITARNGRIRIENCRDGPGTRLWAEWQETPRPSDQKQPA